jgi:hypothetical protein
MRSTSRLGLLSVLTLSLAAGVACAGDPALRAASNGDLSTLRAQLDDRARDGKLDADAMRDVSKALLAHDVARYDGATGEQRFGALGGCARSLKDTLDHVASGGGDAAPSAATLLVDADLVDVDAFTDAHRDDANPIWRAVATRGLVGANEAALRATRAKDDDERVRRAAIEAAGDASCACDVPLLLESARHDPRTIDRVDAVRMLAKISDKIEGDALRAELVDRLKDLWPGGDEALRGAIARAWASPALAPNGGVTALEAIVGGQHGPEEGHEAVEAAAALMQAGGADGETKLVAFAEHGDAATRAHALRLLDPMRPAHLDVLRAAMQVPKQGPDDAELREVAAESIARLPDAIATKLPKPEARGEALATLRALANANDRVGTEAAIVLADLGVDAVAARLFAELSTKSPMRPRVAAALVKLGHAADVRALLTDADLDARDATACAILATH